MYYSTPSENVCTNPNRVGSVNAATGVMTGATAGFGTAYDLAVADGKLYAPDQSNDVVRRASLAAQPVLESIVNVPGGSGPTGVTVVSGSVWVTLRTSGQLARFPVAQQDGDATTLAPTGTLELKNPTGIVASGDGVLVAGTASRNIVRVTNGGAFSEDKFDSTDAAPVDLVPVADGAYVADSGRAHLYRFADAAPTITVGETKATSSRTASATVMVDTHGNATDVTFEYGPTTNYGKSTTKTTVAASAAGPSPVTAAITDLDPGTTYHIRAKATNARGDAVGDDATFTTEAAASQLKAKIAYKAKVKHKKTTITSLRLTGLEGGEKATVTCAGASCPFASHKVSGLKAGTHSLTSLFGPKHKLKAGVKVTIGVTNGVSSRKLVLTTRKTKKPTAKRS
jgi:hypothetical protein